MKKDNKSGAPLYIVDAFTDKPFEGNPAAVCLLSHKCADSVLRSIAAEMNLSETAFLFPLEKKPIKEIKTFSLRWFTPKVEVPLCGHATLATAAVLFYEFDILANEVSFETKSGILTAKKDKSGIVLDFPIDKPIPIRLNKAFLEAVGIADFKNVEYARRLKTLVVHISDENAVKGLRPNFELMKTLRTKEEILGVIVTSHGRPPFDFVSRFFAPWLGINEDPVTGAAHTILAPYWSRVLGKNEMLAYQASDRGGKLAVRLHPNNRVDLIGNAVIVLKGELYLR